MKAVFRFLKKCLQIKVTGDIPRPMSDTGPLRS